MKHFIKFSDNIQPDNHVETIEKPFGLERKYKFIQQCNKHPVMLVDVKFEGTMKSVRMSGTPAIVICMKENEEIMSSVDNMMRVELLAATFYGWGKLRVWCAMFGELIFSYISHSVMCLYCFRAIYVISTEMEITMCTKQGLFTVV